MEQNKEDLEQKVISGTIELVESIINNKTNAITLDDGTLFYRAESHVLSVIANEEGIFSSEIARRIGVTRGAIQKILTRLENRSYITKEVDDTDKKRIRIFLTENGNQAFGLLLAHQMKINAVFFSEVASMAEDELSVITRFLSIARKVLVEMQNPK